MAVLHKSKLSLLPSLVMEREVFSFSEVKKNKLLLEGGGRGMGKACSSPRVRSVWDALPCFSPRSEKTPRAGGADRFP